MRRLDAGAAGAPDRAEPDGAGAAPRHGAPGVHAAVAGALQPDHVQLARLTKRQARDMIATLAGTELPAATLDALVARADGVPLYVEELTKAMAEPGAARGVEAIPATLADSLMARLDRLSTAKEVAQRAAVLGREFGYPLLAAMAGMDEAALRHGLGAPGRGGDPLRARRAARGHVHLQARADPGDGVPVAAQAHAPAAARARRPGAGRTLPRARRVRARGGRAALRPGGAGRASDRALPAGRRARARSGRRTRRPSAICGAPSRWSRRCRRRASAISGSSGCRWRSGRRSARPGDGRIRSTSGPTRARASWRPRSASRPSCRECSREWRRPIS